MIKSDIDLGTDLSHWVVIQYEGLILAKKKGLPIKQSDIRLIEERAGAVCEELDLSIDWEDGRTVFEAYFRPNPKESAE